MENTNSKIPKKKGRTPGTSLKDGTNASMFLKTDLYNWIKAQADLRHVSMTEIVEEAIEAHRKNISSFGFQDSIVGNYLHDKKSILIPKDLYGRLNGMTMAQVEAYIKKEKLEVVSTKADNDDETKRISYIVFPLGNNKSLYEMVLNLQQQVHMAKFEVVELNQKFNALVKNLEQKLLK